MEGLITWVLIMQLGGLYFVGQNEFLSREDCEAKAKAATSNLMAEYSCIPNNKRVKEDPGTPYEDVPQNDDFEINPEPK